MATDPRIPPWAPKTIRNEISTKRPGYVISWESQEFTYLPGQERIKAWMNHVIAEAIEVKESLGYTYNDQLKLWKNEIDWEHVLEEFADILHFLLAAWMEVIMHTDKEMAGIAMVDDIAQRIFNDYKNKLLINHARQDQGY